MRPAKKYARTLRDDRSLHAQRVDLRICQRKFCYRQFAAAFQFSEKRRCARQSVGMRVPPPPCCIAAVVAREGRVHTTRFGQGFRGQSTLTSVQIVHDAAYRETVPVLMSGNLACQSAQPVEADGRAYAEVG